MSLVTTRSSRQNQQKNKQSVLLDLPTDLDLEFKDFAGPSGVEALQEAHFRAKTGDGKLCPTRGLSISDSVNSILWCLQNVRLWLKQLLHITPAVYQVSLGRDTYQWPIAFCAFEVTDRQRGPQRDFRFTQNEDSKKWTVRRMLTNSVIKQPNKVIEILEDEADPVQLVYLAYFHCSPTETLEQNGLLLDSKGRRFLGELPIFCSTVFYDDVVKMGCVRVTIEVGYTARLPSELNGFA